MRQRYCRRFVAFLALAMFCPIGSLWAEEVHPIIKLAKAGVKDPAKPFTLVVLIQAKEGKQAELEAAFIPAIKGTRKEKGCLRYELNRDTTKPGNYLMYERWHTVADLEKHLKAPYIVELVGKLGDLTAGPPEFRILLPAAE